MDYINLNGQITKAAEPAATGYDNAAFRYGYGLFETMLVQNGTIRLWPYHQSRLYAGAKQLRLELPAAAQIVDEILALAEKNGMAERCRIRLQVFAGSGMYGLDGKTGYLLECFPIHDDVTMTNGSGIVAGIVTGLKKSIDSLSNLKTSNALIYAMALREAKEQNWQDALICNMHGNIIESAIANIFWIKDNELYTPPLSEGCVAGVMRQHIIDSLPSVKEQLLSIDTLQQADEVFLANAIRIRSVKQIGPRVYQSEQTRTRISDLSL